MIKYYMNNPCTVVREITKEFSEIRLIPNWTDGLEGSMWCYGCNATDSRQGVFPEHTCDLAGEVIDYINDSAAAIVVVVENRLLHDNPVEFKSITPLQDEIKRLKLNIEDAKVEHCKLESLIVDHKKDIDTLKNDEVLLQSENDKLLSDIDSLNKEIDQLKNHKSNVQYNTGRITISTEELRELLDSQVKLNLLENGGVDNWDWYGESLSEGGDIDIEVEKLLTSYIK